MHPEWDTISVPHLEKLLPLSTEVAKFLSCRPCTVNRDLKIPRNRCTGNG